jgi:branched-chain amino acid transport system substrate-binding protein
MVRGARQWFLILAVLSVGILCFTVSPAMSAEKGSIKVGLLLPYTGTMPLQAKGVADGVELYFDEIGRKAGGRPIEIVKEDT